MKVRLFARARELAEADVVDLDLPPGSTVGDLRGWLAGAYPRLAPLLAHCALALDGEFAVDSQLLSPTSEVALLPPVSGG
jgi:molybdopterin converting factor subunit 1